MGAVAPMLCLVGCTLVAIEREALPSPSPCRPRAADRWLSNSRSVSLRLIPSHSGSLTRWVYRNDRNIGTLGIVYAWLRQRKIPRAKGFAFETQGDELLLW